MRVGLGLPLIVGLVILAQDAAAGPCSDRGQERAVVESIEARLELRLADGRLVRMAGLDPASPTPADPELPDTARARLSALLPGKEVTLTPLSTTTDRWGRVPALVFTATGEHPGGLAAVAIAAGLGRYLAEPAAHTCRDELIAAEREARAAKLGLWHDPYYAVLAVDDHAGFAERSATIVLAEGQLTAVEPSPYRTTLRFASPGQGAHGGHMQLVATIPPRVMKTFDAQGLKLPAKVGQRLRFRGLLDLRFGPRVELDGPDAVETDGIAGETAAPAGAH